jgi:hypothetical protein
MFKKHKLKKNIDISKTIDDRHYNIIQNLNNNKIEKIPKLEEEKTKLKLNIKKETKIENILNIKDRIKTINKEIKILKKEKKNYYLKNSKYIFQYFESKQKIIENKNTKTVLNNFFFNNSKYEKDDCDTSIINNNNIDKYLSNVDSNYVDLNKYVIETDICKKCNTGELIPIDVEGIVLCNNCSNAFELLIENDKPSYKEPPKDVCFYAYKRINHFREILAQFQAKETTQIPKEVFDNIKNQIKKERMTIKQLTNKKAKDILKKLGYNKYYEHIPFIKDKLGIKPPVMSPELEDKLCNLFMEIQAPYAKYCPDNRVNFLNYYYTIYKLCELLNQIQYLRYFPMLKDVDKRIEQDIIWKNICKELNWDFVPTI